LSYWTWLMMGMSSKPLPSTKNSRPPAIDTFVRVLAVVSFLCRRPFSSSATQRENRQH
jgi:hypothetical protein